MGRGSVGGVGDPKGVRLVVPAAQYVAVGAGPGWFGGVQPVGARPARYPDRARYRAGTRRFVPFGC